MLKPLIIFNDNIQRNNYIFIFIKVDSINKKDHFLSPYYRAIMGERIFKKINLPFGKL